MREREKKKKLHSKEKRFKARRQHGGRSAATWYAGHIHHWGKSYMHGLPLVTSYSPPFCNGDYANIKLCTSYPIWWTCETWKKEILRRYKYSRCSVLCLNPTRRKCKPLFVKTKAFIRIDNLKFMRRASRTAPLSAILF